MFSAIRASMPVLPVTHGRPTSTKKTPTVSLTQDECTFFWENGYLSVPGITTPEDINEIRRIYDRLFDERAGWADGNYFDLGGSSDRPEEFRVPQIQRMSDYAPELFQTQYYVNALATARQLLGAGAKHLFDHGIRKPPTGSVPTPWHQDIAFITDTNFFESLTVWMPLQPVDAVNGCMSFIPNSHRGAILTHRSPGGDDRINGLEAVGVDTSRAVSCPLPAGGATFHHCRTLHATTANNGTEDRRVMSWGFGIRRRDPQVVGTFPWIAAKDNERLHRLRAGHMIARIKQVAQPFLSRILVRQ